MYEILLVAFLVVSLSLIGLVLIQQGKGADMGASFGSGASNTVFGSSGSASFLTRTTAVMATLFFLISLVLGNMSTHKSNPVEDLMVQPVVEASAVPAVTVQEASESDVPN